MKTKEVEVWVYGAALSGYLIGQRDSFGVFKENSKSPDCVKAKLIIDLPERKVTISESDLDGVIGEVESDQGMRMYYRIKEKLFGDTK